MDRGMANFRQKQIIIIGLPLLFASLSGLAIFTVLFQRSELNDLLNRGFVAQAKVIEVRRIEGSSWWVPKFKYLSMTGEEHHCWGTQVKDAKYFKIGHVEEIVYTDLRTQCYDSAFMRRLRIDSSLAIVFPVLTLIVTYVISKEYWRKKILNDCPKFK